MEERGFEGKGLQETNERSEWTGGDARKEFGFFGRGGKQCTGREGELAERTW